MVKMMDTDRASCIKSCFPETGAPSLSNPVTYSLYGLRVQSNRPLPLAPIEADTIDLSIRFEDLISLPDGKPPGVMTKVYERQEKGRVLRFQNPDGHVLEFVYDSAGTRISLRRSYPEWQDSLLALLSVAVAVALHLQGRPVLHATSLVKDGMAFLLTGPSGVGKSSLAAALATEGVAFHADDVSALSWNRADPFVQAGYPRLKITPQTAGALGWPESLLLPVCVTVPEYPEKWVNALRLPGGFHHGSAPLRAIYVLSGRSIALKIPQIETLPHGQAAIAVARCLYGNSWLEIPPAQVVALCARIAAKAAVHRVWLPEGLGRLRSAAGFVVNAMQGRDASSGGYAG
jgi:YD repeat-containing protein